MVILKACPRCHGDVHKQRDKDGLYTACLQCGHVVYIAGVRRAFDWMKGKQNPGRPRKAARKSDAA